MRFEAYGWVLCMEVEGEDRSSFCHDAPEDLDVWARNALGQPPPTWRLDVEQFRERWGLGFVQSRSRRTWRSV
jgi:hypothetical protein